MKFYIGHLDYIDPTVESKYAVTRNPVFMEQTARGWAIKVPGRAIESRDGYKVVGALTEKELPGMIKNQKQAEKAFKRWIHTNGGTCVKKPKLA